MICVETANNANDKLIVQPGQRHTTTTTIIIIIIIISREILS